MPKKLDPSSIKATWEGYDLYPPWSAITSMELSKILGVHLQTINNWRVRQVLPEPIVHKNLVGNKNYFRISSVRSWLEQRSEEEIAWEWAALVLPDFCKTIETLSQLEYLVKSVPEVLGVKKPNVPAAFTFDHRTPIS